MKPVYIKDKDDGLKYFIFGINEKNDEIDSEEYRFEGIKIIKNNAFQNLDATFFSTPSDEHAITSNVIASLLQYACNSHVCQSTCQCGSF